MRQNRARQQPQPADVSVECLVPLIFGDPFGGPDVQHASIVQQDVDSSEVRGGLLNYTFDAVFFGNIGGDYQRGVADFTREFCKLFLTASDERDLGAFASHRQGASAADAAAGA